MNTLTRMTPAAWAAVVLISGCATVDTTTSGSSERQDGFEQVDRAARMIVGRYIGLAVTNSQSLNSDSSALIRLMVSVDDRSSATEAVLRMQQSDLSDSDQAAREFLVSFRPVSAVPETPLSANRLVGAFAPLNTGGQILRSCLLDTVVRTDGLVARTRAADCQFSGGNGSVSLVKEIAHDGQRLVIGDRLLDAATGKPVGPDRIIQFDRVLSFSGWAGVRDDRALEWRLASNFDMESDGIPFVPRDAGGMDLGIALEVAPYRWREDESSVLRIRVFDLETHQLLGQSWANWNASQIGLALPDLQVGLMLETRVR